MRETCTTFTTFTTVAGVQSETQELGENPKDRIGITKPPLHLVPAASMLHQAEAMRNGADKYGPYNWREKKVKATIYVSAAQRHIAQWLDGEECAEDSGVHHLGHALACLGILLDAQETGNLVDDRPVPGAATKTIERLTKKPTEKRGVVIAELTDREDEEARMLGFADAEARPEYVTTLGIMRAVEDSLPDFSDPDLDATLRGARNGKQEAVSEAHHQYGIPRGGRR